MYIGKVRRKCRQWKSQAVYECIINDDIFYEKSSHKHISKNFLVTEIQDVQSKKG